MNFEEIKKFWSFSNIKRVVLEGLTVGLVYAITLLIPGIFSIFDPAILKYFTHQKLFHSISVSIIYFVVWGILLVVLRPYIIYNKLTFAFGLVFIGALSGSLSWLVPTPTHSILFYVSVGAGVSSLMLLDVSWWTTKNFNTADNK